MLKIDDDEDTKTNTPPYDQSSSRELDEHSSINSTERHVQSSNMQQNGMLANLRRINAEKLDAQDKLMTMTDRFKRAKAKKNSLESLLEEEVARNNDIKGKFLK